MDIWSVTNPTSPPQNSGSDASGNVKDERSTASCKGDVPVAEIPSLQGNTTR
ncbi:hypothetical protein H6G97_38185 [Nostoc flagelliforme FACHB-838]|uniref:Uncharacterized protein n=1 Tax=Nostoc flagelliforme FACHB-838 TaxID=2692904 RepID=A0ABR8E0G3_9NOSO|nr:hypothetical protein [Nostoc flagelliforme FACHB-838]